MSQCGSCGDTGVIRNMVPFGSTEIAEELACDECMREVPEELGQAMARQFERAHDDLPF